MLSAFGFAGASIILGLLSDGVHHDDDLTHFLFARWSWWYPEYLVQVWGRPGFTVPMALVSGWFDRESAWHIARAASACVTLASALIAAQLARRLSIRCWPWVVALCYLQPLNTVLSYTTLTENFAALYLIAALYLLHRRSTILASVVFSMVLVTRLETAVLLPVWAWCIWRACNDLPNHRRVIVLAGIASLWAPIVQNLAHRAVFRTWPVTAFLHPSGSTEYLATGPLAFVPPLLLAASPIVILLAIIGAPTVMQRGGAGVVALATVFLATHWLIKWFGIFASGGFARFVVSVAPLLAIAAAAGLQTTIDAWRARSDPRLRYLGLGAIALLVMGLLATNIELRAGRLPVEFTVPGSPVTFHIILAVIASLFIAALIQRNAIARASATVALLFIATISIAQSAVMIRPLQMNAEHQLARKVAHSLRSDPPAPAFAPNPWIAWWSGHVENPRSHKGPRLLSTMPIGTRFVWDAIYSPSDFHRLVLSDYLSDPAYRVVSEWHVDESDDPLFVVIEKLTDTQRTTHYDPYPRPLTLGRGECSGGYYVVESNAPESVRSSGKTE